MTEEPEGVVDLMPPLAFVTHGRPVMSFRYARDKDGTRRNVLPVAIEWSVPDRNGKPEIMLRATDILTGFENQFVVCEMFDVVRLKADPNAKVRWHETQYSVFARMPGGNINVFENEDHPGSWKWTIRLDELPGRAVDLGFAETAADAMEDAEAAWSEAVIRNVH